MRKPAWSASARTGPVRRFRSLVCFACEGLVVIIDERDGATEGDFTAVTPSDMEERLCALSRMYRNKTRSMLETAVRDTHDADRRGIANIAECVKEAREMGDPSDPRVQAYWARHRKKSGIVVPFSAGNDAAGYPQLPVAPAGIPTTRLPTAGAVLLHKSPRRRIPRQAE